MPKFKLPDLKALSDTSTPVGKAVVKTAAITGIAVAGALAVGLAVLPVGAAIAGGIHAFTVTAGTGLASQLGWTAFVTGFWGVLGSIPAIMATTMLGGVKGPKGAIENVSGHVQNATKITLAPLRFIDLAVKFNAKAKADRAQKAEKKKAAAPQAPSV